MGDALHDVLSDAFYPHHDNNSTEPSPRNMGSKPQKAEVSIETIDFTQPGATAAFMSFLENRLPECNGAATKYEKLLAVKTQIENLLKQNPRASLGPLHDLIQKLDSQLETIQTEQNPSPKEEDHSEHSESEHLDSASSEHSEASHS